MQIALIYDTGTRGQEAVKKFIDKYGEPIRRDMEAGEILWKTEEGEQFVSDLMTLYEIGDVILMFFVGGNDEDMTQFLTT